MHDIADWKFCDGDENPGPKIARNFLFEKYKKNNNPSVNHFYEKLLLLKDLMNTKSGSKMAQERHLFMEKYLEQFYKEI